MRARYASVSPTGDSRREWRRAARSVTGRKRVSSEMFVVGIAPSSASLADGAHWPEAGRGWNVVGDYEVAHRLERPLELGHVLADLVPLGAAQAVLFLGDESGERRRFGIRLPGGGRLRFVGVRAAAQLPHETRPRRHD